MGLNALKAIVIGMGVLIVCALLLLAYGLYKKSVDPTWKLFGADVAPAGTVRPFDAITLGLAPGCRIEDVTATETLAYVRTGPDSACDDVIVVDVGSGRILGRISPR